MKRALFLSLCAGLLLSAQQGALIHSVWHLRDRLPAHEQRDDPGAPHDHEGDESPSPQAGLCVFHAALGSLFAGGCAAQLTIALAGFPGWFAHSPAAWRVAQSAVTPPSRAPPVLL